MKKCCDLPCFAWRRWKKITRVMKLTITLLLIAIFTATAGSTYSQSSRLNLKMKNASLVDVFREIERTSEFGFFFKSEELDQNKHISVDLQNATIDEILNKILIDNYSYKILDKNIIITRTNISNNEQQKSVTGKVTDSTGGPLPGVSVVVKGTTTGTITDFDGNYSLANVSGNAILQFSFVGMRSQEIAVGGKTTINVSLADETIGIEEVVAVGYGVQKKSVVTGAISSVKSEDIRNSSNTRPEQSLQGKTSGVQIVSSSGAPGSSLKIRVRGYSSNGNSDPLYIVDGLRTDDISGLEPSNIASMEVLKDGASAAIYGAEGGNGVILITTKNGSAGKSEVLYDFQYTIQSLGRTPKVMNAQQYIKYMDESGAIKGLTDEGINTNWINESFEAAPMQKHNITFSGGNDKTTYLASMSYLDQEGIVVGDRDKYKRYSGMFNGSQKLNK